MQGMMGLVSVITVPLVVSVVFKGETMAAMGAYNSVMGKYQGDKGGASVKSSLTRASSAHSTEAEAYEDYARRVLRDDYNGATPPKGALASEYLDQLSSQAAAFGANMGTARVASEQYKSDQDFVSARASAGMGTGMQRVTAEIASGSGLLESINKDPNALENFGHQTKTDSMAGFESMAHKGDLAQTDSLLSRDNQIEAAKGSAELDMRKSVASGLGASQAFADGSGADFMYQTQTDSEAMIKSTANSQKTMKTTVEINKLKLHK